MAHASAADMIARKRVDTINDLCNDEGHRQSLPELLTNANLSAALDDASGAIDAALVVGKRYSVADLTGLTGNNLALLKRITCDLAMSFLYERNPRQADEATKARELAMMFLKKLSDGENVFNLDAPKAASLPTIDGPSSVDYARLNLMPDRTKHFYPSRGQRLPTDRS